MNIGFGSGYQNMDLGNYNQKQILGLTASFDLDLITHMVTIGLGKTQGMCRKSFHVLFVWQFAH